MSLIKKEHWLTEDLPQFLESRRDVPFAWGSNDCATFAADAIQAITGTDIAVEFRGGRYTTERGALRAIKQITGGATVVDAVAYCAKKHGLVEYQFPLMARRGDLVIVRNRGGGDIAGIVSLNGRHVLSPGDNGLVLFSITDVIRAWNLGNEHQWTPPAKVIDTSLPELQAPAEQKLLASGS